MNASSLLKIKLHPLFVVAEIIAVAVTIVMGLAVLFGQSTGWLTVLLLFILVLIETVRFLPAFLGTTDKRQLVKITCPLCKGSGRKWNRLEKVCTFCDGRSYVYTFRYGRPDCRPCKGTGREYARIEALCSVCGGIGLQPFEIEDRDSSIWKAAIHGQ